MTPKETTQAILDILNILLLHMEGASSPDDVDKARSKLENIQMDLRYGDDE